MGVVSSTSRVCRDLSLAIRPDAFAQIVSAATGQRIPWQTGRNTSPSFEAAATTVPMIRNSAPQPATAGPRAESNQGGRIPATRSVRMPAAFVESSLGRWDSQRTTGPHLIR